MSDRIRKQLQEISLGINDSVVELPFDLCEEAIEENRYSLIVKPINPRRQNLRAMMVSFPRLWGVADVAGGRIVENQKIQFLFRNEEAMLSVLRRGPWSFNEWMVSVQRWSPSISDEDMNFISFWIQVRGIPIQYLSTRMVTRIGQGMGQFMETDFQTDGAQNVDFVRIRLLCNVSFPLRFQRMFRFGGETVVLRFRYEKLRGFCSICGVMSHDVSECPLNKDGNNDDPPPEDGAPNDDDEGDNDHPPGFPPQSASPYGPHEEPDQETTDDNPTAETNNKRRKTADDMGSTSHQNVSEIRQAFMRDEYEEVSVRKRMRTAGEQGVRNWYTWKQDGGASTSDVQEDASMDQPTNREGTVGQKPPEPG
ncbi:hypothetical protein Bca4012_041469 [Brassica carinata]